MKRSLLHRLALLAVLSPILFMANSCPPDSSVNSDPADPILMPTQELKFLTVKQISEREIQIQFDTSGC